jgi:hypothetical protein
VTEATLINILESSDLARREMLPPILSLPPELLLSIADFLVESQDLHSLCLSSKLMFRHLMLEQNAIHDKNAAWMTAERSFHTKWMKENQHKSDHLDRPFSDNKLIVRLEEPLLNLEEILGQSMRLVEKSLQVLCIGESPQKENCFRCLSTRPLGALK